MSFLDLNIVKLKRTEYGPFKLNTLKTRQLEMATDQEMKNYYSHINK